MFTTSKGTHILVFPFPAQGHMLPLLDLTNQLALRGLTITIVITPKNLHILTPLLSSHTSSIHTLVLPLPSHPKLPAGVEHVADIGPVSIPSFVSALSRLAQPISDWFHSHPSPPLAILSDFFLGWTLDLAQHQLRIPRFAFYASGCFMTSVGIVLFPDIQRFKSLGSDSVHFHDLPRSPVFEEQHLPFLFRFYNESDPDWRLIKDGLVANHSSSACVFNSFQALESDYFEYLRNRTTRVYGVGPISLFLESETPSQVKPDKVMTWLDACPDGSVLYVSFGSQKWLTRAQLQALGLAMEKSETRFIWVVRSRPDYQLGGWLEEFEERVEGRGYIVKSWAPQVEILGHRAVGGFLSHCGWNSILESVVAGVIVLAWPMEADQYVNARLLVEDLGVGVRVCEGADKVPDSDKLGVLIAEAMAANTNVYASRKQRSKELKEKAIASLKDGGDSAKDLDEFVTELVRLGTRDIS